MVKSSFFPLSPLTPTNFTPKSYTAPFGPANCTTRFMLG